MLVNRCLSRYGSLIYKSNLPSIGIRWNSNSDTSGNKLKVDTQKLEKDFGVKVKVKKSPETELAKYLKGTIRIRGPLTVSQYFREALTNEKYGYYTKKDNIFGTRGDFITAPEISQLFGEMLGIWVYQTFSDQFKSLPSKTEVPSSFRIVEIGPGRGTLMFDILRSFDVMSEVNETINVHFIEASPKLRAEQAKALGCSEHVIKLVGDSGTEIGLLEKGYKTFTSAVKVHWHKEIHRVPGTDPVFILAQEFLDALPVNVFEYTDKGWRELMVDVDDNPGNHHFRYIAAKAPTVSSMALYKHPKIALPSSFVPKVGQRVEVSSDRAMVAERIGEIVAKRKGAALIVDYGNNYPACGTLRACKNHEFEDILCEPGQLDITSDVDFQALGKVFEKTMDKDEKPALNVFGPITQGCFLKEMGIQQRVLQLLHLHSAKNEKETIEDIISGYKRLVHEDQMGQSYKVMSIIPKAGRLSNYLCGFPPVTK